VFGATGTAAADFLRTSCGLIANQLIERRSVAGTAHSCALSPMTSTLQPLIVAVDDEADDISYLRLLLQKTGFGHTFQPFSNGEAAIAGLTSLAQNQDGLALPMVCFLDIKLTGMNGFELLRWIRGQEKLSGLPALMFSSSDDPNDVEQARGAGAQAYLKKYPSVEAMRTVLDEARDFSALPASRDSFLQWNYRFVDAREPVMAK
jgi:CheY-like chemotaxis protein